MLIIDRIVVSMIVKIGNNNYSEMPTDVAVSKDFFMWKVWCEINDFEHCFLAGQITIQSYWDGKIHEVGQSFWDAGSKGFHKGQFPVLDIKGIGVLLLENVGSSPSYHVNQIHAPPRVPNLNPNLNPNQKITNHKMYY